MKEAINELNKEIAKTEKQLTDAKKNKEDQLAMLKKQVGMMGGLTKNVSMMSDKIIQHYISLYKLSSGKTSHSFTINTDGSTNAALIPLNFIPAETRVNTKIMSAQALIPGEYAFVDRSTIAADGNITVWTFGIDN
jgi:hypothetical protein